MITSAKKNHDWPLDSKIGSLKEAGLSVPSRVRMKIFNPDSRLLIKKIDRLSSKNQQKSRERLKKLFPRTAREFAPNSTGIS